MWFYQSQVLTSYHVSHLKSTVIVRNLWLVENKGSLILMLILSLNGNLHKKWMQRHGQAIRTSVQAVRWEEDDTGFPKRLAIELNTSDAQ